MNLDRLHDTLTRVAEFLDGYSDVVDGSYGEPQPNQAMQLVQAVELELAIVEREMKAAQVASDLCKALDTPAATPSVSA